MSLRHVVVLALLAALLGGVVWWLQGEQRSEESVVGDVPAQLLPDLAKQLDSANRLEIVDASEATVTLEFEDALWVVKQKKNYRANQSKVKSLLIALSQLTPAETKTSNPEYYERLGLRDISNSESEAYQIEVLGLSSPIRLLVGTATPRFGGSSYTRLADQARSYLATPRIDVSTDVDDWLDKKVLDVAADDIQSVVVTQSDGSEVEISKEAMFGEPFSLNAAEDREPKTTSINTLARGLTGLNFENVARKNSFAFRDFKVLKATYRLFDGTVINASLYSPPSEDKEERGHWLSADVSFDEVLATAFVPQPTEGNEGEPLQLTPADIANRKAKAEALSQRLRDWIYEITFHRHESFDHTLDSLSAAKE